MGGKRSAPPSRRSGTDGSCTHTYGSDLGRRPVASISAVFGDTQLGRGSPLATFRQDASLGLGRRIFEPVVGLSGELEGDAIHSTSGSSARGECPLAVTVSS